MRYLITGGAGFIGSHLADALVSRGDEVLVLDDLSTGRLENLELCMGTGSMEFVEGSILDEELVDRCTGETDVCLHLAAAVGVERILERPLDSLIRNVRGSDVVISSVVRSGGKILVASSSEVYGKNNSGPLEETSDRILGPPSTSRWAYSTAKAFSEVLANAYACEQQAESIVVRFFNTVGPRQTGSYGMVLPRFVQQALSGEPLTVYGDGTQTRCFTHVSDVTAAVLSLCGEEAAVGKTFNIGSPNEISILELAQRVLERTGSGSEIVLVPYETAYPEGFEEIGRRHPELTRIGRIAGWAPRHTIDEMIDDVISHCAKSASGMAMDLGEAA
ncbi:MAG TPA: NAD-dependent epimerase/dehydratase family protein [Solirubrobacterales bacterium]|nr:NAD-dependent epimerase/dehydratase family protein [Solirubrobacterales bacterium]